MSSSDVDFEQQLLRYFAGDDWAARGFQPVSSIFDQIQPNGRAHIYFSGVTVPDEQSSLAAILEQMADDGLLEKRRDSPEYEPAYFATDQGIYEASFDDAPLVPVDSSHMELTDGSDFPSDFVNDREHSDNARPVVDSSSWTGLPKMGVLAPAAIARLQEGLRIVDQAIERFDGTNEERAQARAYFIAIQALSEAPEPPADLIWQIIKRADSLAGIASLFVALIALFK